MTSNTNNKSDQSETLLYKVLLYMKKDIKAIQKKLGINSNALMAVHQSKKAKTLDDSYELLFNLVEELRSIPKELQIGCHPLLTIIYRNQGDLVGLLLGKIYHL